MRFYLDASDSVANAPSIGPKTAERLAVADIRSVTDLIEASAATVAKLVAHQRINEQTIVAWQQQANLACRIPRLRGHDAQILVACGVKEPAELAAMDERKARILELRFFGGLKNPEIAETLDVSLNTVEKDWYAARAWLRGKLA